MGMTRMGMAMWAGFDKIYRIEEYLGGGSMSPLCI